jgi:hypothetical protein
MPFDPFFEDHVVDLPIFRNTPLFHQVTLRKSAIIYGEKAGKNQPADIPVGLIVIGQQWIQALQLPNHRFGIGSPGSRLWKKKIRTGLLHQKQDPDYQTGEENYQQLPAEFFHVIKGKRAMFLLSRYRPRGNSLVTFSGGMFY